MSNVKYCMYNQFQSEYNLMSYLEGLAIWFQVGSSISTPNGHVLVYTSKLKKSNPYYKLALIHENCIKSTSKTIFLSMYNLHN